MLSVSGVLRDAAQLYQALFWRTLIMAALVFSIVCLAETVGPWPVVGVTEFRGGKISAWREYFELVHEILDVELFNVSADYSLSQRRRP